MITRMIKEIISPVKELIDYRQTAVLDYQSGGILSRKVHLDYNAVNCNGWMAFINNEDKRYSFVISDIQLGEGEANFWHDNVKEESPVSLDGYVSRLYCRKLGFIRGYLTIPEKDHKMGVVVYKGIVLRGVSDDYIRGYHQLIDNHLSNMVHACAHLAVENKNQ